MTAGSPTYQVCQPVPGSPPPALKEAVFIMPAASRVAAMTRPELLGLPAAVPLWPTAARALGIGRTKAHQLARAGQFPVPLLRLGAAYRVRTTDLWVLLGIEP